MDKEQLKDRVRQILNVPPDYQFIHERHEELLKYLEPQVRLLAERMLLQTLFDYLATAQETNK